MSCAPEEILNNVSIIIPVAPDETAHEILLVDLKNTGAEIILSAEGTRAKSLNEGAKKAKAEILWFLHADSRVSASNLAALEKALQINPDALHYFDLKFDDLGLSCMNALGANIRSHLFDLPYGDQGLCLSKAQFKVLGGYPEDTPYGEDLLFVRRAKGSAVKLNRVPSKLQTSTRKYREYGWLKLTFLRQWQLMKLLRQKP